MYNLQALIQFYGDQLPLPAQHLQHMFVFILKHNYFTFNKRYYLQTHGTAMGATFAPIYANISMANIEDMLMSLYTGEQKPKLWRRFIDDIFFIWEGDEDSLLNFFNTVNSVHESIIFEFSYSKTSINFLHTTIRFDKTNNLASTLCVKENDICTLLHSDSYHPENCKRGIIYSQALGYRRIITNDSDLENHLYNLKINLLKRDHITAIKHEFHKVRSLSQIELLNMPTKKLTPQAPINKRLLPFIIPYDDKSKALNKAL